MTKTYEIRITVTVDNEETQMKIDSAFNKIQTIEALERMIVLLNEFQDSNLMPS